MSNIEFDCHLFDNHDPVGGETMNATRQHRKVVGRQVTPRANYEFMEKNFDALNDCLCDGNQCVTANRVLSMMAIFITVQEK
jgi:hypothetical protein